MSKEGKYETLRFWRVVEEGINLLKVLENDAISDECLRIMKRIYRKLRKLIVKVELSMIDRWKEKGMLTPKEAREEKAKVRKRWL